MRTDRISPLLWIIYTATHPAIPEQVSIQCHEIWLPWRSWKVCEQLCYHNIILCSISVPCNTMWQGLKKTIILLTAILPSTLWAILTNLMLKASTQQHSLGLQLLTSGEILWYLHFIIQSLYHQVKVKCMTYAEILHTIYQLMICSTTGISKMVLNISKRQNVCEPMVGYAQHCAPHGDWTWHQRLYNNGQSIPEVPTIHQLLGRAKFHNVWCPLFCLPLDERVGIDQN